MDAEARLNEVADHLAHEGLTYRASRVREGASEIARQRHRIERLETALAAKPEAMIGLFVKQLNAKLADEYRNQVARIGRLEAAIRCAQDALGEGEWIAASDILFDALAEKEGT